LNEGDCRVSRAHRLFLAGNLQKVVAQTAGISKTLKKQSLGNRGSLKPSAILIRRSGTPIKNPKGC
jgi:hypothetical protein